LPAPFEKPSRPTKVLRGSTARELRVVEDTQRKVPSFPLSPVGSFKIEMAASLGGGGFVSGAVPRDLSQDWHPAWNTSCAPGSSLLGLQLETFRIVDGGAELEIADGLFDQDSCAADIQQRTTLHPAVLLTENVVPLVFELRTDEGVLLLF